MADVVHGRIRLAFAAQVFDGGRLGGEEPVRDAVGDETVDFLGHRHVAAAQAGFDVGNRDVELLGDDRAGQRGVDVADHEDGGRTLGHAQLFEADHDLRGLLGVAAAAGGHEHVRLGNAEFFEKDVVHFAVVVLTGVDDLEGQCLLGLQRTDDRRNLHEIGPCARDQINKHVFGLPYNYSNYEKNVNS